MSPPAHAALLLRTETRLRAKLARAERTIGRSVGVLPALGAASLAANQIQNAARGESSPTSWPAAELHGEIARRLACWRSAEPLVVECEDTSGIVAGVRADSKGWLALLDDGRLVATHVDGALPVSPSESPETILRALACVAGSPRPTSAAEQDEALHALDAWIARDWTQRSSGLEVADAPMRRRVRRVLDEALRVAPRHRRATILCCAATIREALARPLPLGVERALSALAEAWRKASSGGRVAPRSSGASVASRGAADWVTDAAAIAARAPIAVTALTERAPCAWRVLILFGEEARVTSPSRSLATRSS
jgi:hypothetical protein